MPTVLSCSNFCAAYLSPKPKPHSANVHPPTEIFMTERWQWLFLMCSKKKISSNFSIASCNCCSYTGKLVRVMDRLDLPEGIWTWGSSYIVAWPCKLMTCCFLPWCCNAHNSDFDHFWGLFPPEANKGLFVVWNDAQIWDRPLVY